MSDCVRVRARLEPFLDGELPAPEEAAVRAHLEACGPCRAVAARERAFLDRVREAGRESAPPELRRWVEAALEAGGGAAASSRPGRRAWAILAAAAVAALLLVARPWEGPEGPATVASAAFAADHRAHAASAPSAAPFPIGASPAPPLAGGDLLGLSRCVVAGRAYAHFAYRVAGATVSVFVPLDEDPLPEPRGATDAAVVGLAARAGRPPAVLVSDGLAAPALRGLWERG